MASGAVFCGSRAGDRGASADGDAGREGALPGLSAAPVREDHTRNTEA